MEDLQFPVIHDVKHVKSKYCHHIQKGKVLKRDNYLFLALFCSN